MKLPDEKPIQLSIDVLENAGGLNDLDQLQTDLRTLKDLALRLESHQRHRGGFRFNIMTQVIAALLAAAVTGAASWAWTSQSLASSENTTAPICSRPENYLDV